ncbi:MAG: hypothetical protein ACREDL_01225 [Bradyrhizobium sp.]
MAMSYWVQGILGATAAALTLGVVQLASGHDLNIANSLRAFSLSASSDSTVNRAAKADRAIVAVTSVPTRTISIEPVGLAATSVLVRIPLRREASDRAPTSLLMRSAPHRPMVGCEPAVSVLTAIARKLQPGRCLS